MQINQFNMNRKYSMNYGVKEPFNQTATHDVTKNVIQSHACGSEACLKWIDIASYPKKKKQA